VNNLSLEEFLHDYQDIKGACCNFYEQDIVKILFGDSFHPGGLNLTKELGKRLNLTSEDKLLDIASGLGTSAIYLGETFGSTVVWIDLSEKNINEANEVAKNKGLDNVSFMVGDAEQIRFNDEYFDVIISECSFCLFPNKNIAAKEMYRTLRVGGKLGITDVTIEKVLPQDVRNMIYRVACIADALSMTDYRKIFSKAGFVNINVFNRKDVVSQTISDIKKKLFIAELAKGWKKIKLENIDLKAAKSWLKKGESLVKEDYGTYMMLTAQKSASI